MTPFVPTFNLSLQRDFELRLELARRSADWRNTMSVSYWEALDVATVDYVKREAERWSTRVLGDELRAVTARVLGTGDASAAVPADGAGAAASAVFKPSLISPFPKPTYHSLPVALPPCLPTVCFVFVDAAGGAAAGDSSSYLADAHAIMLAALAHNSKVVRCKDNGAMRAWQAVLKLLQAPAAGSPQPPAMYTTTAGYFLLRLHHVICERVRRARMCARMEQRRMDEAAAVADACAARAMEAAAASGATGGSGVPGKYPARTAAQRASRAAGGTGPGVGDAAASVSAAPSPPVSSLLALTVPKLPPPGGAAATGAASALQTAAMPASDAGAAKGAADSAGSSSAATTGSGCRAYDKWLVEARTLAEGKNSVIV